MSTDPATWSCLEPFLNPTQVRILVALRDSPMKTKALSKRLGHSPERLAPHLRKLNRWGIINYEFRVYAWRIPDWDLAMGVLKKTMEAHLRGAILAIDDLRTAVLGDAPPRYDHTPFLNEVRQVAPSPG